MEQEKTKPKNRFCLFYAIRHRKTSNLHRLSTRDNLPHSYQTYPLIFTTPILVHNIWVSQLNNSYFPPTVSPTLSTSIHIPSSYKIDRMTKLIRLFSKATQTKPNFNIGSIAHWPLHTHNIKKNKKGSRRLRKTTIFAISQQHSPSFLPYRVCK